MPLDHDCTSPMYLIGRLVALAEQRAQKPTGADDRPWTHHAVPSSIVNLLLGSPATGMGQLAPLLARAYRQDAIGEIMAKVSAWPENAPIEQQGDYWIAFYQQRGEMQLAGSRLPRSPERARIERAGRALYGQQWQTDLSRLIGWEDSARLRQVLRGDRALSPDKMRLIAAELRQREQLLGAIAAEWDQALADGAPEQGGTEQA